jgi:hypothetical protein
MHVEPTANHATENWAKPEDTVILVVQQFIPEQKNVVWCMMKSMSGVQEVA